MQQTRDVPPPAGLRRLLLRIPIALYRARLGWILGSRFLLLEHRGRRSGALHRTVLEVVRSDPARAQWWVVAAWGERTQWLHNLRAAPRVRIETAGRAVPADAQELPRAEAEELLVDYGRAHPRAIRAIARLLGWRLAPGEADLRALASVVRVVRLSSVAR